MRISTIVDICCIKLYQIDPNKFRVKKINPIQFFLRHKVIKDMKGKMVYMGSAYSALAILSSFIDTKINEQNRHIVFY